MFPTNSCGCDATDESTDHFYCFARMAWRVIYICERLTHFHRRNPWVTPLVRDMSWNDLDVLLSSDDSIGLAYTVFEIARSLRLMQLPHYLRNDGFNLQPPSIRIQRQTTHDFYVSGRDFCQFNVGTLQVYEGLYPLES